MKKILMCILPMAVCLIGNVCLSLYYKIPGISLVHIPLLVGSQLLMAPAVYIWHRIFKTMFQ